MKYIYLHGFASGVKSSKAQYFDRRFSELNLELCIPDLNRDDFSCLTLTRQIQQTALLIPDSIPETQESVTIVGSSFGGLTAAFLAEMYPQVKRLILLAPAFNFLDFWLPTLGEARVKEWQELGFMSVYHYGEKRYLPLQYQFVEDLQKYSLLTLQRNIPTLIFHGVNDRVIPVQASRDYACDRPWVRLRELNSDHGLVDVLEIIWQEMW